MRRINDFNSIIDLLRETFPLEVSVHSCTENLLAVVVPYFPSCLCNKLSSKIVFSVRSYSDSAVFISFYII